MGKGYVESLGDVVRFSQFMEVAAEEMEKMTMRQILKM